MPAAQYTVKKIKIEIARAMPFMVVENHVVALQHQGAIVDVHVRVGGGDRRVQK